MPIDKALMENQEVEYETPAQEAEDFDIPASEMVENPDGTTEYIYEDDVYDEIGHDENLVQYLAESTLNEIGAQVIEDQQTDRESRAEWENTIVRGLELLGLKLDDSGAAFDGGCTAHHPLILEAATKFQSKASVELFPSRGPAHTQMLGRPSPEKEAQALRVKNHLNYQLVHEMEEYFPDTERMLLELAMIGSEIKKTYWDETLNRPVSEFVQIQDFDVAYNISDLRRASRYTHTVYLTKNEYEQRAFSGLYDESIDIGEPVKKEVNDIQTKVNALKGFHEGSSENDEVYTLLEQHTELVLPIEAGHPEEMEDIALPYVVTVEKNSEKVVAIRKLWEEEDEDYKKQIWFTHYQFVPGLGFYGLGFIHLLGNLQMTLTAALRSLVDSGQFANMQGGFKSKQMRIKDDGPIAPGEYKEVEAAGMKLSELIMPLPAKEPSTVLYQMLDYLSNAGQKFADSTEQVIQESTNYGPVGTTMALLEASTKFFTAIHKRLHFSQKHELKLIAKLNYLYLPEEGYKYDVVNGEVEIFKADFDGRIDVVPVSDPNISSQAQRIAQAETLIESALRAPEIHDLREIHKNLYTTMGVENVDKILPLPPEAKPLDPLSDILSCVRGLPIKAFPGQNHDAHIQVKTAWMQDPANGANEMMLKARPRIEANIQEHMVMKYQEQMTGMIQASGAGTDPQTVEMVQAQAAQEIAFNNEQTRLQGELQSPEMMMAQAEQARVATDAQQKDRQYGLDSRKLDIEEYKAKVDAAHKEVLMQLQEDKNDLDKDRLAADLVRAKMTEETKKRQQAKKSVK